MKLIHFQKVKDGKYLKNYELQYINKSGKEKTYEIVSRNELSTVEELGKKASGVSIVALCDQKLLLLKEFRMGVNKEVYNLCAGMLEKNETIEECIQRELAEETGLNVKRIITVLPPSYAAVAISDTSTYIAIIEAEGTPLGGGSDNEEIKPKFYTKEEINEMLRNDFVFSSRAQIIAYFYSVGAFDTMFI